MSELLDPEGLDWDYSKLVSIFNPADADAISRIKLPARRMEDFIAWQMEKTGVFTVRSAYNLAMLLEGVTTTSSSTNPNGDRKIWNNIWRCHVPPKIRIFAWKLSKDVLPTKVNKLKRKLEVEDTCNICGLEREDSYHAVVRCRRAFELRQVMREHWPLG